MYATQWLWSRTLLNIQSLQVLLKVMGKHTSASLLCSWERSWSYIPHTTQNFWSQGTGGWWSRQKSHWVAAHLTVSHNALNQMFSWDWHRLQTITCWTSHQHSASTWNARIWSVVNSPGMNPDCSGLYVFSSWLQICLSNRWIGSLPGTLSSVLLQQILQSLQSPFPFPSQHNKLENETE